MCIRRILSLFPFLSLCVWLPAKAQAGWRTQRATVHCCGFRDSRGFKVRITRCFFGASSAEKAAPRLCALVCSVSCTIMLADVRLYIFLLRGGVAEFHRSRCAEFMRPDRPVEHQSSISGTEMLSTYIFLALVYFMRLFYCVYFLFLFIPLFFFSLLYVYISKIL